MTANGTEISDGESLSGSQVLRVYGSNLTPPYFSLWFNGVEYTPLDYGEGYVEYVLQDNGTYEIRNEHDVVMEFEIEGINVPAELPAFMELNQSPKVSIYTGDYAKKIATDSHAYCLNVPVPYDVDYPYYIYRVGIANLDTNRLTCHNCVISASGAVSGGLSNTCYTIIDSERPAFVELDGFIIIVFNYTTTP